jgi:CheY-like chemotaxis protein
MDVRILLVEDHENTLDVMGRLLRAMGHEIHPATSVAAALQLAQSHSLDLVISDLGLPDGTGHDLMRMLRDRFGLRGIALSGYDSDTDFCDSRDAGFATHIVKPVNFGVLESVIAKMADMQ